jgi:Flp pilus assembly secretin CpaC
MLMPDAGSPHTHPDDYTKIGLDFERDNAAIPRERGEPSPELAEAIRAHIGMPGVQVEAFGGSVLLTGIAADRFERERAESRAHEVEGVGEVENRIRIQQSEAGGPVLTVRDPNSADEPTNSRS